MALPTVDEIEKSSVFQALKNILRDAEKLNIYAAQVSTMLRNGTMTSERANSYLKTLQAAHDRLASHDPAEVAELLALLSPKGADIVAEHTALLADTNKRLSEMDNFLTAAGLKPRELSQAEADALRAKLEGAQAASERV